MFREQGVMRGRCIGTQALGGASLQGEKCEAANGHGESVR